MNRINFLRMIYVITCPGATKVHITKVLVKLNKYVNDQLQSSFPKYIDETKQ